MPPPTSRSLLERARDPADAQSWRQLTDLYLPLIRGWVRPYVDQPADVDDVVQEVLAAVVRDLGRFQHNEVPGAFRAWLRSITMHRLHAYWQARARRPRVPGGDDFEELLGQLEDPASPLARSWDEQHDRHVLRVLCEAIRLEFHSSTWWAFEGTALDGRPAAEVAAELGLTLNAVLVAKSRVLKRLRQKAQGLVD
jgi:RNA polymerase sigma-70 factor (ECF subfamily)